MTANEALQHLEAAMDALLIGRSVSDTFPPASAFPEEYQSFVEKFVTYIAQLEEAYQFARAISRGEIDYEAPGRNNYLAAPLKEIHSQVLSLNYSMDNLIQGNMVSKLYFPGSLFEKYNKLVTQVAQLLSETETVAADWGSPVSSWRYHQLLSALNQLHIMIIEVDLEGKILFMNPPAKEAFPALVHLAETEDDGKNLTLFQYLRSIGERLSHLSHSDFLIEDFPIFYELLEPVSGAWYKITSGPLNLADGSYGLIHTIDDISEWKYHEESLIHTATTDPLTSTYTRKAGMQKLEEVWQRREEQVCSIMFADIDNLKMINDTYGHTEGDHVIQTIANILCNSVREADWVIRYGGDEFLVLLTNCDEIAAKHVLRRTYQYLEEANAASEKPYTYSFSVGLATLQQEIDSIETFIQVADQNMYEQKQLRKKEASS